MSKPVAVAPPAMPSLPVFSTPAETRKYRKEHLAAAYRLFAHHGLDEGAVGHLSIRDPEDTSTFWTSPFGQHFGLVRASTLLHVTSDGTLLAGAGLVNPAAVATHAQLYRDRPDVNGIAHAHSFWGKVWSATAQPIVPNTQESCTFFGDHAVVRSYEGIVSTTQEAERVTAQLGSRNAAILQNHGLLTVASTIDGAAWRCLLLEKCCEAQIHFSRLSGVNPISDDVATATRKRVGSEFACWGMFQPLYQFIVRREPDLLG